MKKINIKFLILTLSFLATFPLLAQSVNDDFLNGIPDELKKEILANGDNDKYEEDIYISEESKTVNRKIERKF